MATIFTKIIRGEIPSFKIFEDEHTYAFLDIRPIQLGHSLIVPKQEIDHMLDLEEPFYSAVFRNAKPIGQAIQRATNCERIGTAVVGFEVPHFHYHVVPMYSAADLDFSRAKDATQAELAEMQKKILASF